MENIYGTCECEAPLEPVWFTEYERKLKDSIEGGNANVCDSEYQNR